jgi:hypothetical protein
VDNLPDGEALRLDDATWNEHNWWIRMVDMGVSEVGILSTCRPMTAG